MGETTSWFAGFASAGPGANPPPRVAWVKAITPGEVAAFTPEVFLTGYDRCNDACR
jgi:hypothetical protein